MTERGTARDERPQNVRLEDLPPLLAPSLGDGPHVPDRRIVHQRLEATVPLDRGRDEPLDLRLVAHVGRDRIHRPARLADPAGDLVEPIRAARADHDGDAGAGQRLSHGGADAGGRPRHDRDPPGEGRLHRYAASTGRSAATSASGTTRLAPLTGSPHCQRVVARTSSRSVVARTMRWCAARPVSVNANQVAIPSRSP